MKFLMIGVALLTCANYVCAQTEEGGGERPPKGMSLVADGLYGKTSGTRQSFYATNAAGRAAIAEMMRVNNEKFAKLYAVNGVSPKEQILLTRSQQTQAQLLAPQTKAYMTGGCGNGAYLVATAYASDGVSAHASAVNALDFSPATPTTNIAYTRSGTDYNEDIQTGTTEASSSSYSPSSCLSEAYAIVICPSGYNGGAGPAYEFSTGSGVYNCQIQ